MEKEMGCCRNEHTGWTKEAGDNPRQSLSVRWCVSVLKGYKRFLSPLFPPSCRFTPTCSEYAIDALQSRGFFQGFLLACWRLLRCHPFARGGYDPVD